MQAMVTLTLLAQGMDPGRWQPQFRWWRGFISRAHWRTLTNMSSMASKTIESVALVGTAMKLFQAAIGWVRYLNGGERIRLQDVLYAAGHVYGAWTVGTQITALASSLGWSWTAAALLGQIAWIAWALAVLIYASGATTRCRATWASFWCAFRPSPTRTGESNEPSCSSCGFWRQPVLP
jgi:hypothetical protein